MATAEKPICLNLSAFHFELLKILERWWQVFTWSSSNAFNGEITTTIFLGSKNKGMTNGMVFPAPVPAITEQSSPTLCCASPSSTCHDYSTFPGLQWQNSACNVTWVDADWYPLFLEVSSPAFCKHTVDFSTSLVAILRWLCGCHLPDSEKLSVPRMGMSCSASIM